MKNFLLQAAVIAIAASASAATPFVESFENWDGADAAWLPEGWSVVSYGSDKLDPLAHWLVTLPQLDDYTMPEATDGQYFMCCGYSDDHKQDEWLIMPSFTPSATDVLTIDLYSSPLFYFLTDTEHFDDNTLSFIKKVQCANFEIMVRPTDDEQWTTAYDGASLWQNETALELMMADPDGLEPLEFDLAPYAGREITIAFRYSGQGGSSVYLDNVRLGATTLLEMPVADTLQPSEDGPLYNIAGQRFDASTAPKGIYIQLHTDGTTVKKIVR